MALIHPLKLFLPLLLYLPQPLTLCRKAVIIVDKKRTSKWRKTARYTGVDIKRSLVKEAWNASGGSAGAITIASIVTNTHRVKVGRWVAGRLMKELGIGSCQSPAYKYQRGGNEHVEIPNLLDRQFAVTAPNQVWCGDVTYIWTGKRWAYLAVVHVRLIMRCGQSPCPGCRRLMQTIAHICALQRGAGLIYSKMVR